MTHSLTFDVSFNPDGLSIVLSSTMEFIDRVDTLVKTLLEERGLDKHSFAVRVVLREGLTNAVRHGHKYIPDHLIRFDLNISGTLLTMTIEDQGDGFDWRELRNSKKDESQKSIPADHGRGYLIMGDYFDTCDYNEKGNILILKKNISS